MVDVRIEYSTDKGQKALIVPSSILELDLGGRGIIEIDLQPLAECRILHKLKLSHNSLKDIDLESLRELKYLQHLEIEQNGFTEIDLGPLEECRNLRELSLLGNRMMEIDLEPLGQCRHLRDLCLSENEIAEINLAPLERCINLENLDLLSNKLRTIDLQPLANCTKLKELSLAWNQLAEIDLNPLVKCVSFGYLFIGDNRIRELNITPLARHRELYKLEMDADVQLTIDERCLQLKPLEISPLISSFMDHYSVRVIRIIPSVFLSHSSENKKFARKLARDLKTAGIRVWLDEAEILVGESLIERISQAIEDLDFVAAIISEASVDSDWVKKELYWAMTREIKGKRVIVLPIRKDNCEIPFFLEDKLYADFRKDYKKQLENLIESIRKLFMRMVSE